MGLPHAQPYVAAQLSRQAVMPDLCSARFVLHCEPEVGGVSWRSIWSCCQFRYSCIWARQRG